MNTKHYHNTSDHPVFIGGVSIPPGASRQVDARLVPGSDAVAEADAAPPSPWAELLAKPVADVVAALQSLGDIADLDAIEAAEQAGKHRKGVLEGIAADRLRRAATP